MERPKGFFNSSILLRIITSVKKTHELLHEPLNLNVPDLFECKRKKSFLKFALKYFVLKDPSNFIDLKFSQKVRNSLSNHLIYLQIFFLRSKNVSGSQI